MDHTEVINTISQIPVGTIVAWGGVIIGLIVAITAGIVRLYKVFGKFKKEQDAHDQHVQLLLKHEEVLDEIHDDIKKVAEKIDTEADVHMRSLKHTITSKCNRAIKDGEILMSELRSIEEIYDDYSNIYHGNSWAHVLVEKARKLPIIYDLDDE